MDWTCPRCGCHSYHYKDRTLCFVCDSCGTPRLDPEEEERRHNYARSIAQAQRHMNAGNWDQVIGMVSPLTAQNPDDTRLYGMLLRAATCDYGDIVMADAAKRRTAAYAWQKLVRLNGANAEMHNYAWRRAALHRVELRHRRAGLMGWLSAAAVCFLLAAAAAETEQGTATALAMIVGCVSFWQFLKMDPFGVVRQLRAPTAENLKNPFL